MSEKRTWAISWRDDHAGFYKSTELGTSEAAARFADWVRQHGGLDVSTVEQCTWSRQLTEDRKSGSHGG
jgi:hypothetical protein